MALHQPITTPETAFYIRDDSPGGDTEVLESDSIFENRLYLRDHDGDVKWFFLGYHALLVQGLC